MQENAESQAEVVDQPSAEGNLAQIRDILFGSQQRSNDQRFLDIEDRISREIAELRGDIHARTDHMEEYVREQFKALTDQLGRERDERTVDVGNLYSEAKRIVEMLQQNSRELGQRLSDTEESLRGQTTEQMNELRSEMHDGQKSLDRELQRAVGELSHNKADRSSIGQLLQELGSRLTDDHQPNHD